MDISDLKISESYIGREKEYKIDKFKILFKEKLIVVNFRDYFGNYRMLMQNGYEFISLSYDMKTLINDFESLTLFVSTLQAFIKNQIVTFEKMTISDTLKIRKAKHEDYVLELIYYPEKMKELKVGNYEVITAINKIKIQQLLIYLTKIISKIIL